MYAYVHMPLFSLLVGSVQFYYWPASDVSQSWKSHTTFPRSTKHCHKCRLNNCMSAWHFWTFSTYYYSKSQIMFSSIFYYFCDHAILSSMSHPKSVYMLFLCIFATAKIMFTLFWWQNKYGDWPMVPWSILHTLICSTKFCFVSFVSCYVRHNAISGHQDITQAIKSYLFCEQNKW